MNIVIQTIREHIANSNVLFVFPSQTAVSLWARKTCTLGISRSVALNRFLAWDRFKEGITEKAEKEPVTAIMRKLFAEALIQKSAKSFKALIPAEYAENGSIFAPYIARLLPSLSLWGKLMKRAAQNNLDPEDSDYEFIKKEYEAFLERYNLFEPSWEEINIKKKAAEKFRYFIFFP
ncbi:MAG: hypothetical protein LBI14_08345 [Treponema sp.]|jgi:hypothetical protein|nr:hypothetical protein [Treponema sp.]